jgi:hypothetical protein
LRPERRKIAPLSGFSSQESTTPILLPSPRSPEIGVSFHRKPFPPRATKSAHLLDGLFAHLTMFGEAFGNHHQLADQRTAARSSLRRELDQIGWRQRESRVSSTTGHKRNGGHDGGRRE